MRSLLTLKSSLFSDTQPLNAVFSKEGLAEINRKVGSAGMPGTCSNFVLSHATLMTARGEYAVRNSPRKWGWQEVKSLKTHKYKPGSEFAWAQTPSLGREGVVVGGNHPNRIWVASLKKDLGGSERVRSVVTKASVAKAKALTEKPPWRNAGLRTPYAHKLHPSMRQDMVCL